MAIPFVAIIIFISIILGNKKVCDEFVDDCVPFKEQWKSNFAKKPTEPPQGILDDKGHMTETSPNLPDSAPHNLDWRHSSQSQY